MQDDGDRVVAALVIISALVWTNVLATFCDIVTNGDPQRTEFHQRLEVTNKYLEKYAVPDQVRRRVPVHAPLGVPPRGQGRDVQPLQLARIRSDLIHSSPTFAWLWKVRFFANCDEGFLRGAPLRAAPSCCSRSPRGGFA